MRSYRWHTCSVPQSCQTFWDPMDYIAHQAPLSMDFSRQGYRNELPFLPPEDLPIPGIKPVYPALAGRFFTTEHLGSPITQTDWCLYKTRKGGHTQRHRNMHTKESPCEDTARSWPSVSQGERSQKKLKLPPFDLGLLASRMARRQVSV